MKKTTFKNPWLPDFWRVLDKVQESSDTYTLKIKAPESCQFSFLPGQFNMMYLPGVGEVPISISGEYAEGILHTVRSVGKVSHGICQLGVGDTVGIRGPFGSHWPVETTKGKDVVFVAGGIGLAPLRSAIIHFLEHRGEINHLNVIYGARTPEDLIFTDELLSWQAAGQMKLQITVDSATPAWRGNVGVVPSLINQIEADPKNTMAMVCGPEIMMRYSQVELEDYGLSHDNIYLSMERNMQCAIGSCGHCQYGPKFICKDGPVFNYAAVKDLLQLREL